MNNGEALSTVRKRLGLTKKQAAEKIGCTPKTYAKYEKEGLEYVRFIAVAIDMGVHSLESKRHLTIYFTDSEPLQFSETMGS